MKVGEISTSPSVCQERSSEQVSRSGGRLPARSRSDHRAAERESRRRGNAQHRQMEHGLSGGILQREAEEVDVTRRYCRQPICDIRCIALALSENSLK
jgi:hypothetical protein